VTDEPSTLRDSLLGRALADPERLAYDDGQRRIGFGKLAEVASERAARLRAMGVGAGDRVAIVMSAGIAFAETFWAIQLLGAAACAFNPGVPTQTLRRRIDRVRPRLVLGDDWLESAPRAHGEPPDPRLQSDDIAFLQPTSGTSGEPRAAMVRHRNVLAYLRADRQVKHATRDDVFVTWVPPWHDLGLVRFLIGAVDTGAPCHIVQPAVRTIPDWLATIGRTRATTTGAPDFCWRLATRMVDPASVDLSSLRFAINGGEPVRRSTVEQFERRFDLSGALLPGYGLAEATLGVTTQSPGERLVVDAHGNVSSGRVRPGLELRVDGDATSPGEILVRGEAVFAGYFDAIDETRTCLRDGWLHTGDSGYLDANGRLFVLGRRRAMIKRGGAVVAPRELEEAAQDVDGVRLAAAVGLEAATAVTETVTVVIEAEGSPARPCEAVAAAVSQAIVATSGFAPGRVLVVPRRTIPRTENGKVRHARLRELLLAGAIDGSSADAS
jgi:acyl-CoA synthetase (AMP-forming)/AMP-acid ligase II